MHLLIAVKTVLLAQLRNRVDLVSVSEHLVKEYFWNYFTRYCMLGLLICYAFIGHKTKFHTMAYTALSILPYGIVYMFCFYVHLLPDDVINYDDKSLADIIPWVSF